jgi:hypothetical protein
VTTKPARALSIAVVVACTFAGVGCSASPREPTVVTFDGSACRLTGLLSLEPGLNEFHLTNTSGETGNFIFARLEEGFTAEDVENALRQSETQPGFVEDVILSHFPNGGDIGFDKTVSYDLTAGTWALVCATNLPVRNWVAPDMIVVG